jgi:uncharacterized protein
VVDATHSLYLTELARMWADNCDLAHDVAHVTRVWHSCQTIAAAEQADLQILHPAAILHDCVNFPKSHPDRAQASRLSADHVADFLQTADFPAAKITAVHHTIHAHSFSANVPCTTIEAKILQDADRLDALGAIGIARCFAISGTLNRALFHPTDPMAKNRDLDEIAFALDHFQTKLFPIAETLHTQQAHHIAAQRIQTMRIFCDSLVAELR